MLERIAVIACILVLSLVLGLKMVSSLSSTYFASSDGSIPTQENLYKLLGAIDVEGRLKPGAQVKVAELRRTDGTSMSFIVAEGSFNASTIEPSQVWQPLLGKKTIIVSSADEKLRNDGGISKQIGSGCNIQEPKSTLATGAIIFSPCEGNYKDAFPNIESVASAIIKAWNGSGVKPACDLPSDIESEKTYSKCIQVAIESALQKLLASDEVRRVDALVLPELGTGTAQLEKGLFYQSVMNSLEKCLILTKGCEHVIPARIIFTVWAGDSKKDAWSQSRLELARSLEGLANDWHIPYEQAKQEAKEDTKYPRYLGVLMALLGFVCFPLFYSVFPSVAQVPSTAPGSLSLVILGWALVAIGMSTSETLSSFVPLPSADSTFGVIVNVLLGAVAALSCGVIHKAVKAFEG